MAPGTALTVLYMALSTFLPNKGDKEPFCYYPKIFKPTMTANATPVDIQKYSGTWYDVAHKVTDF